jgi:hypothetical protein
MAGYLRAIFLTLCTLVALTGAALGLASALQSGPAWDDALEISVMNRELKVGSTPGLTYEEAKTAYGETYRGHVFYGVAVQYAAHAITSWRNGTPWAAAEPPSVKNVAVRHLLTMLIALVGAAILAVTAALLSGRMELGFAVAAVLMSTPVFVGQSAINVKDVPVGIGITIFSCGAALLLLETRRPRALMALAGLLVGVGAFLAVGTRAGAIALVGFEAAILGAVWMMRSRIKEVAVMAAGLAAGILVAALINPFGRKAPIQWLWESVAFSPSLGNPIPTTLYGVKVQSTALPWWYVPGWIVVEYPLPFLVLAVIGAAAAISRLSAASLERALAWLPFVIQGLILPLVIVVTGATFYDRLRHIFFFVPPLCLLAGFGLYICYSSLERRSGLREKALALVGAGCLAANFAATVLWHPYQYAYLNAFGRLFPKYSFDTDYWGLTITEAVERMKARGVTMLRAGPAPVFLNYFDEKGMTVQGNPSHIPVGQGFYYTHIRPSWRATGLPKSCRKLFEITRQGVRLGVGGEC